MPSNNYTIIIASSQLFANDLNMYKITATSDVDKIIREYKQTNPFIQIIYSIKCSDYKYCKERIKEEFKCYIQHKGYYIIDNLEDAIKKINNIQLDEYLNTP